MLCLGGHPADATRELHILGEDGDALGVGRVEVGVVEVVDDVSLTRLLERTDGVALEPELRPEVLSDLARKTREGALAKEEFGGLLVAADLAEGDGARTIAMGLLDATGGRVIQIRYCYKSIISEYIIQRYL